MLTYPFARSRHYIMRTVSCGLVALSVAPSVAAYSCCGAPATVQQRAAVRMGLFDGVKNAFGTAGGEKPLVAADRVTPFDRWLGLDKALIEQEEPDQSAAYIDPNDATNYFSVELSKPMGIAFVENDGECGGVYIDEVLSEGSAASATAPLQRGDQLVGVDATPVIGNDFDTALDVIKGTSGDTTKLTFFRGPTAFLYGPTAPKEEWYKESLLA